MMPRLTGFPREGHHLPRPIDVAIPPWRELARYIAEEAANPFAPVLATGASLSALMGSTADAAMVMATVGLSGLVGGIQRFQSERALTALGRQRRTEVRGCTIGQQHVEPGAGQKLGDTAAHGPGADHGDGLYIQRCVHRFATGVRTALSASEQSDKGARGAAV